MKPLTQMNVIPFIDIMLVMLAVVLTTATFVAQGKIPINLPTASSSDQITKLAQIDIVITVKGKLFFASEPTDIETISQSVSKIKKETPILLRVDENTPFRHFVAIIDLLKSRGLPNVSIVTIRG